MVVIISKDETGITTHLFLQRGLLWGTYKYIEYSRWNLIDTKENY